MNVSITQGYVPGAIGRITELHADYYSRHWGFGVYFEAKVARELAEFSSRFKEGRDGIWHIIQSGRIEGGIVIDGLKADQEGAHLRWFIIAERLAGRGLGNRLVDNAMSFCRTAAYKKVCLWTFEGLDAARYLYEKHGFHLEYQKAGEQWGTRVVEQKFVCSL